MKKLLLCSKCNHGYFKEKGHTCGDWRERFYTHTKTQRNRGDILSALNKEKKIYCSYIHCNKEFKTKRFYQKYCSKECKKKSELQHMK